MIELKVKKGNLLSGVGKRLKTKSFSKKEKKQYSKKEVDAKFGFELKR